MNLKHDGYSATLSDIDDLLGSLAQLKKQDSFIITFHCLDRGLIKLNIISGDFCKNKKCKTCMSFKNEIKNNKL